MNVLNILNAIVLIIGIPTLVGTSVFVGRKLQMLDSLVNTVEKIKHNVKIIADFLIASDLPFNGEKLRIYSPVHITQTGWQYLKKVNFVHIFSEHTQDFFEFIQNENPKTDYDIENAAIKSILFLFDEPYFNSVKDYFYNNPKNKDMGEFIKVAGIYVRDKYKEYGNGF